MANQNMKNKVLRDYVMPSIDGATIGIIKPTIQATHFEIKFAIIQMIPNTMQFNRLSHEDPNWHIANFFCDTFKQTGVTDDTIKFRLFPLCLKDKENLWLNSLALGTITTLKELTQKFMAKYFPSFSQDGKIHNDITTFTQCENESLYEAWEYFKDLLTSP